MKRLILSLIALAIVGMSFGQADSASGPLKNKKGIAILPEGGDMAIGINAAPFLTYAGNILNQSVFNGAPALNFLQGNNVYVKYFLDDQTAIRASVQFTTFNNKLQRYVRDDNAYILDPLSRADVIDERITSGSTNVIGLGYEKRRGKTRLQGFYGAGLNFLWGNSSSTYTYGNTYSAINPNPNMTNFDGNVLINGDRVISRDNGGYWGLGANAFIGVEYFIMPKISLGGELAWGVNFTKNNTTSYDYEHFNGNEIGSMKQMVSPGDRFMNTATANPFAGIFVMFHF